MGRSLGYGVEVIRSAAADSIAHSERQVGTRERPVCSTVLQGGKATGCAPARAHGIARPRRAHAEASLTRSKTPAVLVKAASARICPRKEQIHARLSPPYERPDPTLTAGRGSDRSRIARADAATCSRWRIPRD